MNFEDLTKKFLTRIQTGNNLPIYERGGELFVNRNSPFSPVNFDQFDVEDYVPVANALANYIEHNQPLDPATMNALAGKVSSTFQSAYTDFSKSHSQLAGISYNEFISEHAQPGSEHYELSRQYLSGVLDKSINISEYSGAKVSGTNKLLADVYPQLRGADGKPIENITLKDLRNTVTSSLFSAISSAASVAGAKGKDALQFASAVSSGVLESFFSYDRWGAEVTKTDKTGKPFTTRSEQSFLNHALFGGRNAMTQESRQNTIMEKAEQNAYEMGKYGDFSANPNVPAAATLYGTAGDYVFGGNDTAPTNRSIVDTLRKKYGGSPILSGLPLTQQNAGFEALARTLTQAHNTGEQAVWDLSNLAENRQLEVQGFGVVGGSPVENAAAIPQKTELPWYRETINRLPQGVEIGSGLHYDPQNRGVPGYFSGTGAHARHKANTVPGATPQQLMFNRSELEEFYDNYEQTVANLEKNGIGIPKPLQERKTMYDKALRIWNKGNSGEYDHSRDPDNPAQIYDVLHAEDKDPGFIGEEQRAVMLTSTVDDVDLRKDRVFKTGMRILNEQTNKDRLAFSHKDRDLIVSGELTHAEMSGMITKYNLDHELNMELRYGRDTQAAYFDPNTPIHDVEYQQRAANSLGEALSVGVDGSYTADVANAILNEGRRPDPISVSYRHGVKGTHDRLYKTIAAVDINKAKETASRVRAVSADAALVEFMNSGNSAPMPTEFPDDGLLSTNPLVQDRKRSYSLRNRTSMVYSSRYPGMTNRVSDVGIEAGEQMVPGYDRNNTPAGSKWERPHMGGKTYDRGNGVVSRGRTFVSSRDADGKLIWMDAEEASYANPRKTAQKYFEEGAEGQAFYGKVYDPDGNLLSDVSEEQWMEAYQQTHGREFRTAKQLAIAEGKDANRNITNARGNSAPIRGQAGVVSPELNALISRQNEVLEALSNNIADMRSGVAPVDRPRVAAGTVTEGHVMDDGTWIAESWPEEGMVPGSPGSAAQARNERANRINLSDEARQNRLRDPLNPLISRSNPRGEANTIDEQKQLWRAYNSVDSLKTAPRHKVDAMLYKPDFLAFNDLGKSASAKNAWHARWGPEEDFKDSTSEAAYLTNKMDQWVDIKSTQGSDGMALDKDSMREKIVGFDPDAANDPKLFDRYYDRYKAGVRPGMSGGVNINEAAYGYDYQYTGHNRTATQPIDAEANGAEGAAGEGRLSRDRRTSNYYNLPISEMNDRRVALAGNRGRFTQLGHRLGQMDDIKSYTGVVGQGISSDDIKDPARLSELFNGPSENAQYAVIGASGEVTLGHEDIQKANIAAREGFLSAVDPNKPLPATSRNAVATVKSRMQDYQNELIKGYEKGWKEQGFTPEEIKTQAGKFKEVYKHFQDKFISQFRKELGTLFDEPGASGYKDESYTQYNSVKMTPENAAKQMASNPAQAAKFQAETGMSMYEAVSSGKNLQWSDENTGESMQFGQGDGTVPTAQPKERGGWFGKGNTRSLLYGAMMMRYAWKAAGEPTLKSAEEYGTGMAPIGVAAGVGDAAASDIGSVGGYAARQSMYKEKMAKGAFEVYGGFSETAGLLPGGGAAARLSAYAGPALGLVGGSLAVGGSMSMFGAAGTMINTVGKALPGIGAALAVGMIGTGVGMELYNRAHPDQEPLSIGTAYRDTIQNISFASSYSRFASQREQEIIDKGLPTIGAQKSQKAPWYVGMQGGEAVAAWNIVNGQQEGMRNAATAREEWATNSDFRASVTDPYQIAALTAGGATKEEIALGAFATNLSAASLEDEPSSRKSVAILAAEVGQGNMEMFYTGEFAGELGKNSRAQGVSTEGNVTAAARYASSRGLKKGTAGYARAMKEYLSSVKDPSEAEEYATSAARWEQMGGQLQYQMGSAKAYQGLGNRLASQYDMSSKDTQNASTVLSAMGQFGEVLPANFASVASNASKLTNVSAQGIASVVGTMGMAGMSQGQMSGMQDMLSDAGISNQGWSTISAVAGGDWRAASWQSWQSESGDPALRYFDQSGNFAGKKDGMLAFRTFSQPLNAANFTGNLGHINLTSPESFAGSLMNTSNPDIINAFLNDGGMLGVRKLANETSYNNQMASIGNAMAGITLQREHLWGGGTWDKPAEGSMYYLEDRMRNLQHSSQLQDFEDQEKRMNLQNSFSIQSEGIQQRRMETSHGYNNWQTSFNYSQSLTQRGWAQEDWGYQDQMRGLNQGWAMEDLDEAIRFSSGRGRRSLVKQKERMALTNNLEDEQLGTTRERQQEVWAAEDERYNKQVEYNANLQDLDEQNFELGRRQRQEFFSLDQESFERRKDEYAEQKEIQDEMQAKQREYQAAQLDLQEASLGIQAAAAASQKEMNDAMLEGDENIALIQGRFEEMNKYDRAWNNLLMLQTTLEVLNQVANEKFNGLDSVVNSINRSDPTKLQMTYNLIMNLLSLGP